MSGVVAACVPPPRVTPLLVAEHTGCGGHAGTPCWHAAQQEAALEGAAAMPVGSSQHHHAASDGKGATDSIENNAGRAETRSRRESFLKDTLPATYTNRGGDEGGPHSNMNNQHNKILAANHPNPPIMTEDASPPPSSTRRNETSTTDGRGAEDNQWGAGAQSDRRKMARGAGKTISTASLRRSPVAGECSAGMNRGARGRAFHPGINRGGRPRWAQRLRPAGSGPPPPAKARHRGRQRQGARRRACIYHRAPLEDADDRQRTSSSPPRAGAGFLVPNRNRPRRLPDQIRWKMESGERSALRRCLGGVENGRGTSGEGGATQRGAGRSGRGTVPSAAPRRERGMTGPGAGGGQQGQNHSGADRWHNL